MTGITTHVVSLETAKKLKEAGWSKPTICWWNPYLNGELLRHTVQWYRDNQVSHIPIYKDVECIPAPLATEILEELPVVINASERGYMGYMRKWTRHINTETIHGSYSKQYPNHTKDFDADNLQELLAHMWLYLKENKLI